MPNFKKMRLPIDVILVCIRWYAAYPLSYRHLGEMVQEQGVLADQSTINRWAIRLLLLTEKMSRKHKHRVAGSWRMDETHPRSGRMEISLPRRRQGGKTVDFLLTAKRFFNKDLGANSDPDKVTMEKSGANKAAIDAINARREVPTVVREVKYLNNIVEQDHRAIKCVFRRTWPLVPADRDRCA